MLTSKDMPDSFRQGHPGQDAPAYPRALKSPVLNAEDIELLRTLETSPYRNRKDRNPRRVEGTCEWFIRHQLFRDWQAGKSRALWVSADPGCGKSVLAKHLVDNILPTTATRTTCYFFFKDDFEDQKSVTSAVSCLLHQLITQRPVLYTEDMRAELSANVKRLSTSFDEAWELLLRLAAKEDAGEIVCVLDALDECETEGFSELADKLVDLYYTGRAPQLRFPLTSRPFGRLRRGFQLRDIAELAVIRLSGEDEAEGEQISKEIDIFITARVQAISARLRLDQNEQELLLRGVLAIPH